MSFIIIYSYRRFKEKAFRLRDLWDTHGVLQNRKKTKDIAYRDGKTLGHTMDNLWSYSLDLYDEMGTPCCYMPLNSQFEQIRNKFSCKLTIFWKEKTFRHFWKVIFMKKFALIALFTKSTQPMFANHLLIFDDVPQRAKWTKKTCFHFISQTHSTAWFIHARKRYLKYFTFTLNFLTKSSI